MAGLRALLIIAVVVAMGIGYFGAGGIGGFIMAQKENARQAALRNGIGGLIGIIFLLDILFGSLQYIVCNLCERRQGSDSVSS